MTSLLRLAQHDLECIDGKPAPPLTMRELAKKYALPANREKNGSARRTVLYVPRGKRRRP